MPNAVGGAGPRPGDVSATAIHQVRPDYSVIATGFRARPLGSTSPIPVSLVPRGSAPPRSGRSAQNHQRVNATTPTAACDVADGGNYVSTNPSSVCRQVSSSHGSAVLVTARRTGRRDQAVRRQRERRQRRRRVARRLRAAHAQSRRPDRRQEDRTSTPFDATSSSEARTRVGRHRSRVVRRRGSRNERRRHQSPQGYGRRRPQRPIELLAGSNPTDPDRNIAAALDRITVIPPSLVLTFNNNEASRSLP